MLFRWLVVAFAQGVRANLEEERCVTAVYTAYNYISFDGLATKVKGTWESKCRNPLKVASIYAASEMYCNERERAVGLAQLADQCQEFGNLELLPREAVADNLTEDAIRKMTTVDYQDLSRGRSVNVPVLLSPSYFDLMFNTLDSWAFETWSHHAFGYIGYAYWGGIMSLGMIYRLSDWLFHRPQRRTERALESNVYPFTKLLKQVPWVGAGLQWIQTHLIIPTPLATTHGRRLLGFTFSTRVEALIVVGFWMISILLSVVGYRTFPGNIYWPDVPSQILRYSADRTGIMSFANLPLLWLFGGRNNIFLWSTGWSFATFNLFHRHVARVATVQAIVHSVLYVVIFIQTGKVWRNMSKTYVLWGILGTFVMILLLITSLDRIRIATYELFLIAHVVLSILTLIACFYHTVVFEGNEYWKYLWPSVAIWVIDRFLRIVRLCYCNLHVSVSSRRLVKVSESCMVYDETADVVRLEVRPGMPLLQPSPGQYYFLYQPFRFSGWESHPFTVGAWSYEIGDRTSLAPPFEGNLIKSLDVSNVPLLAGGASDRDYQGNSESGSSGEKELSKLKLTFWVRPYDGWTKKLRQQCLSSPAKTSETTILLEGPYGDTFPLWRYESVLFLVGGTGIASAVPYIQDHLRRSVEEWNGRLGDEKTCVRDMELVWTAKQARFIRDVSRRELKEALKREDFSASFYAMRDFATSSEDPTDFGIEIQSGRPNLQSLIISRASETCSAGTSLAILVCGPPRMADEARAATHLAMRQGYRSIKFVEESFTW
ncbi:FRE family ferric-chelate reductase, putative [Penicillium digitatum PHI26]|uniref:FRE family ferric-chelate reductase, putative n=2 Tax=Penicillium digitatum TaxID=36651 RepID=K9GCN5_PEND2|nr:FRE family ferric-chelate reductase, putative [Penicillium digitatum Pd1]EKV18859.1 FRE family ferric-chelate reductase, putative [Penicillium digitatum PHI26]EKV20884.1 FRE family ferric-chelate reductase, putative [Penicillium digitatum Pd1]